MQAGRTHFLLGKYLDGSITPPESEELRHLLLQETASEELEGALDDIIEQSEGSSDYTEAEWDPLYDRISGNIEQNAPEERLPAPPPAREDLAHFKMISLFRQRWMVAAAAAVLLVFAGGLLFLKTERREQAGLAPVAEYTHDVAPGGNKATLTLANDSTIDLTGAKNGLLDTQGNSRIVKQSDGQLAYEQDASAQAKDTAAGYNTLTTPRGGQYHLILPDGSGVWLNAASSIRYPSSFSGKERVVELEGEAYFDVAKNPGMPFRVLVRRAPGEKTSGEKTPAGESLQIEVLGTQFNIMAYADEGHITTTLLKGSVRVRKGERVALIRPGEQASLGAAGEEGVIGVSIADTDEAVAWKNGMFKFDEATIEQVMRQISRWYDVEVIYTNEHPKDLFRGEMYRNVNVSRILKVLQASGVRFTVEGKKIYVQS